MYIDVQSALLEPTWVVLVKKHSGPLMPTGSWPKPRLVPFEILRGWNENIFCINYMYIDVQSTLLEPPGVVLVKKHSGQSEVGLHPHSQKQLVQ